MMIRLCAFLLSLALAATPAVAAGDFLGAFGAWGAFADGKRMPRCYAITAPRQSESSTRSVRRSPGSLSFGFWPRQGQRTGQLHIATGFPLRPGAPARLVIGETQFALLGRGESAWLADPTQEQTALTVLRRGSEATVELVSARGTRIVDHYTLSGLGAALDAAAAACAKR